MRGRRHGVQAARWMGVRGAVAWAEGGGPQGVGGTCSPSMANSFLASGDPMASRGLMKLALPLSITGHPGTNIKLHSTPHDRHAPVR